MKTLKIGLVLLAVLAAGAGGNPAWCQANRDTQTQTTSKSGTVEKFPVGLLAGAAFGKPTDVDKGQKYGDPVSEFAANFWLPMTILGVAVFAGQCMAILLISVQQISYAILVHAWWARLDELLARAA